jgi:hypothetical protein
VPGAFRCGTMRLAAQAPPPLIARVMSGEKKSTVLNLATEKCVILWENCFLDRSWPKSKE